MNLLSKSAGRQKEDGLQVEVFPGQLITRPPASAQTTHQLEKEEKKRFEDRKDLDAFVRPILNLEIFDKFADSKTQSHNFLVLPDSFQGGHQEYLKLWEPLQMYETYSILMSSNQQLDKNDSYSMKRSGQRRHERQQTFVCYGVKGNNEKSYTHVRIYDQPPSLFAAQKGFDTEAQSNLRGLKEFDLIILSMKDLQQEESQHQKTQSRYYSSRHQTPLRLTPDYMRKMMLQPFFMVGMVMEKQRKRDSFLEVKVDISKAEFLLKAEKNVQGTVKLFCYFIASLGTTTREFRVLRMCEFYGLAQTIFNPKQGLAKYLKGDAHEKALEMKEFVKRNVGKFNPSQLSVIHRVTTMKEDELLLIQGPPGTGKTFTTTAIISMLVASGVGKIMVCAPSNAAVDEIIVRIFHRGLIDVTDDVAKLKTMVLRIGSMDYEPSPSVKPFTLDQRMFECLVHARQNELQSKIKSCQELLMVLKKGQYLAVEDLEHRKHVQNVMAQSLNKVRDFIVKIDPEYQIVQLQQKLKTHQNELGLYTEDKQAGSIYVPGDWSYYQNNLLLKAQIICTTLSMSGIEKLEYNQDAFDYLIIDEACQAVELSSLIPLGLNPKRVIMVGDEQQLPATTISDNSEHTKYARSFFQRLLDNGYQKEVLRTQYRMHPEIRRFPSKQFYNNLIDDDPALIKRPLPLPFQSFRNCKRRSMFFDLPYSQESVHFSSKNNRYEAEFTLKLLQVIYERVAANVPSDDTLALLRGQIGIITPYKSQVKMLKSIIYDWLRLTKEQQFQESNKKMGQEDSLLSIEDIIEINTVDAYQGREKEIIIINTVRSNLSHSLRGGLGFVVDPRRVNVAITRAKHFLFVVGHSQTLEKNKVWRDFIHDHRLATSDNGFVEITNKLSKNSEKVLREIFQGENTSMGFCRQREIEMEDREEELKYYEREQKEITRRQEEQEEQHFEKKRLFSQYQKQNKSQHFQFGEENDSESESSLERVGSKITKM